MPSKPVSRPKKKFDGAYATSLVLIAALGATAGVFARQYAPGVQTASASPVRTVTRIASSQIPSSGKPAKLVTAAKTAKNATAVTAKVVTVSPRNIVTTRATSFRTQTRQVVRVTRRITNAPIAVTRGS